jgi:adenylate cyclase
MRRNRSFISKRSTVVHRFACRIDTTFAFSPTIAAEIVAPILSIRAASRLEAGTLAVLREIRKEIVNPILTKHGGRIFKLMGDGMLAEFPSVVQALRAAMGIQERLHQRNAEDSSGRRIEVRIRRASG